MTQERRGPRYAVFVDFDGTITDFDTFDVLVQAEAGEAVWERLEARLVSGVSTLREILELQASYVHCTLLEAIALLAQRTRVDPTFSTFVRHAQARGIPVTVVSSGITQLIATALRNAGLGDQPIVANRAVVDPIGWKLEFRDDSPNGTDKARIVEAARVEGFKTVFIGDGHSDFDAAIAADVRFAKSGRALQRHLAEKKIPFHAFRSFAEVETTLEVR